METRRPPGEPGNPLEWKWVRIYDWSFDTADPNGFPPPLTLLDDYLAWKIIESELPSEVRFRRWPVNFRPDGSLNAHLLGIGRAAKVLREGVWYYIMYRGVELHGQEGSMAGYPRTENISTSSESSGISPTDKAAVKDIEKTLTTAVASSEENRKGMKLAESALTSPNHDLRCHSPPSSPLESKEGTYESMSGPPLSSKRKMAVREVMPEEDGEKVLLRRAVINYQNLLLKADELMHQLQESRNINASLNAWREVALQYNLLSDDNEKLL